MHTPPSVFDIAPQLSNCRAYWLGWAREDQEENGFTLFLSGVGSAQVNGVLALRHSDADQVLDQARTRLQGVPWLWWVGADSHRAVADRLLSNGAREVGRRSVMAVEVDHYSALVSIAPIHIEEVTNSRGLAEWTAAHTSSFGIPSDQYQRILAIENNRSHPAGRFLRLGARADGRLVATAALLEAHGVAGIYTVTADQEHRRRGIGAAVSAAVLERAGERGLEVATLQAGPVSAPLFQRMGFTTVSTYRLFQLPEGPHA